MMLRFDPFRDFDRLASEAFGTARTPQMMPMDCHRSGDAYFLHFDLPGVDPESIDVTAENSTLTVRATRTRTAPKDAQFLISERGTGSYTRQLVLGDGLSLDSVAAHYRDGVLTVMIPVAEHAKPRRIEVGREASDHKILEG
ncbi:Hsp20/alpha crystallin family protein [Frankia sp. CNm7]|uniref:Hsp20/alpha crystallin family protein n=1 Tax=Frankia nepalensis TaxID=1836974 RepID=A0A937RIM5_9ACTN|nr:Hsp20/alpha crystallin family protein [Frankia nepalensis]MBL7497586.1 Hsp20/alpha crystallin family protein [Frankia nepalensis]MBL7509601.1 Hsp20/alpha crystallin family protein [Frankia nepalensis]MBL7517088.1 Hsp20/alpha crystallin family protein [Frankia nepalensis]MBL7631040.1 Hsp20/alpha crystallin family protein [Frankia nepalensis]